MIRIGFSSREVKEPWQSYMQRHCARGHGHTHSRTAYPPWLWLCRMWGKVKEIYQRKGEKKNNINKTQQEKNQTKPKTCVAIKRPVKKPATKMQCGQSSPLAPGPLVTEAPCADARLCPRAAWECLPCTVLAPRRGTGERSCKA